jgi:prolyl-tRNA synthetase
VERLARDAVTVRCLQTPDGGLPEDPDQTGLVAVVARSY